MKKKYILITGASKGLGLSLSMKLQNKFNLILVSRNISKNTKSKGVKIDLDLMKKKSIYKLYKYIKKENIIPDIIIHNLGGKLKNDKHPIKVKVLKKTIKLNLGIPIKINNLLLKEMMIKKDIKIIHISSDCSLNGDASPSYAIAKGALNTYVQNISRKYSNNNILINAFLPGPFIYENSYWDNEKKKNTQKYKDKINTLPLKRFFDVDEVSEVISNYCKIENINTLSPLILINSKEDK